MTRITVRVPAEVVAALDAAATRVGCSRASIVRAALEAYAEDADDIAIALARLADPDDQAVAWEDAKQELLGSA